MTKLVILILVLFASACSTASAVDSVDITSNPVIQKSLQIAEEYWQSDSCNDQMHVVLMPAPSEGGMWWGFSPCTIVVNQQYWADYQISRYTICFAIVHEWGHSLGQLHSDNPDSVMFRGPTEQNRVSGCVDAFWVTTLYGKVRCGKKQHKMVHYYRTEHKHEPAPHRNCFRVITFVTEG